MKRKLVKQGLRALTITLPSSWIKNNSLCPGDEIDVSLFENALMISSESKKVDKEIIVNFSGLIPNLAAAFIARAYQKGYDKITIKFDDPELMLAVKKKVPELMGLEILDVTNNKIEIQIISDSTNLDFDLLLRKAFFIIMDMGKTCEEGWKAKDKKALENICCKDFDVNKFTYFCLRELNKSKKMVSFGNSVLYHLIEGMEDLGDELKVLGKTLSKIEVDDDVMTTLKKMNKLFRTSYDFFYSPQKPKAVEAFNTYREIQKMMDEKLGTKGKELTKAMVSIDFSRRIIYNLTTMRLDTLKERVG